MKLATFLLAAVPIFAQTKATPSATIDKAAIEAYLRHAELWIPQVSVSITIPSLRPICRGSPK